MREDEIKARLGKARGVLSNSTTKTSKNSDDERIAEKLRKARSLLYGDLSDIDSDYINTFVKDAGSFFSSAESDFGSSTYSNHSTMYKKYIDSTDDLDYRANRIKAYLSQNKSSLGEDSYSELSSYLDSFTSGSKDVRNALNQNNRFYSQFQSQGEYDQWEKTQQEYQNLRDSDKDFDTYVNKGAGIKNPTMSEAEGSIFGIGKKDIGNIVTYSRENNNEIRMGMANGSKLEGNYLYANMTENEVNTYNYYLGKYGKDKAQEYLDSLDYTLSAREASGLGGRFKGKTGLELAFGAAAGLDQFGQGMKNLLNTKDDYIAPSVVQLASQMVREDLADNGRQVLGSSLAQIGYDAITTTANMLPTIAASYIVSAALPALGVGTKAAVKAGKIAGNSLLGASSAGNTYAELLNSGMNKSQARAVSTVKGIWEGASEYYLGAIEVLAAGKVAKVLDKTKFYQGLKTAGNGIAYGLVKFFTDNGIEGLQEVVQDLGESVIDGIMLGKWEWSSLEEQVYNFTLGTLTATVLNGMGKVGQTPREMRTVKDIRNTDGGYQSLVNLGKTFDAQTVAYKIADKVDANTGAYTMSRLLHEINANLSEQTQLDIKNALVEKGIAEKDAGSIAEWLAVAVDGGYFTNKQIKVLESDPVVSEVFKNVVVDRNSTVNQRMQSYNSIMDAASEIAAARANKKNAAPAKATEEASVEQTAYDFAKESLGADTPVALMTPQAIEQKLRETKGDDAAIKYRILQEGKPAAESKSLAVSESEEAGTHLISDPDTKIDILNVADKTATKTKADGKEVVTKELVFNTKDNGKVKSSDVEFSDTDIAILYGNFQESDMGANEINQAVAMYLDEKANGTALPAADFANGIIRGWRNGYANISDEYVVPNTSYQKLPDNIKAFARKLGSEARKAYDESNKAKRVVKTANGGKVINETGREIDIKSLKRVQQVGWQMAETLSQFIGNNVHIFESEVDSDGNIVLPTQELRDALGVTLAPNAAYIHSTGDIYLDLKAGNKLSGTMLYSLSHEYTHMIRAWSPDKFKILADFLFSEYGKQGTSVEGLIQAQIDKAKARGRDIDWNTAYEEVVADSMEKMLTDPNVARQIRKLKSKDRGLWQRLKDLFEKLLDLFKDAEAAYSVYAPNSDEAHYVASFSKEAQKKLAQLYAEAFVEAADSYQAAEATLAENGIIVDSETDSGTLLSARDVLTNDQREKVAKAISIRFDVTQEEAINWLKAETSLASIILNPKYSMYLDYEGDPSEVAIKKNSDYPQGTVDFSPICKKRRDFTDVMNAVFRQFPNHVFAATDLAKIRTIMGEEGMILPCGICYVEDRRQLDSIVAQNFIDSLALYRNGSKTRPDGKPFNKNQLKALKSIDGDTYVPSVYELISLEGRNQLKAKNPNMEAAWVIFNNARGMQSVRLLSNEAEYKRQILQYDKRTVKSKNDKGGLRIYSFSDMEMFHLIDIVQVITDSAAVGLKLQGYTKVNEYAKAVRNTGEKLNRSLIPAGRLGYHMENGKVVLDYDTVEGIDINSKDFFDNRDNPNIGNIVIGINATQIRAAMVSDFIDQIIPFHTGQSKEVLKEKNIDGWDNYEDFQSERDIATGQKSDHQINIYTEVLNVLEQEGKTITKRSFVEKFLEVCKENGLEPRFSQFLNTNENGEYIYTEGYHKFLVDFKTFAQTEVGEYLPQMEVKPNFDEAYLTKILKAYAKEQKVRDERIAKSMPKVIERITNEIIKPSETKITGAISLSDRVTDKETLDYLNAQLKKGEVVEVYRAMQVVMIDGKERLVPPMAGKVAVKQPNGKNKWVWQNPSELKVWEQSTEITDFDDAVARGILEPTTYEDGRSGYKFKLKKGGKFSDVPANYAPYIHTSLSTLNDQFTSAYKRENLRVVRGYVPNSEVYGDNLYHAEYAEKPVGKTKWHSGIVAAKMPETREVILSRYFYPVEIMYDAVVAKKIKAQMKGKDIEIPYNVVSPKLRRALENEGVRIGEGQGMANLPPKDSVSYSDRDNFSRDKYFDRQIEKWEEKQDGTRIKVGVLNEGSALNQVGFPAEGMWFDVGKIKKSFGKHGDHLTKTILKEIPNLLNDPIAITEYRGHEGNINNTVNVFGMLMPDGKTPIVVGVVMTKSRNGVTIINKIRTIHARGNADINDNNILYLNEDKKTTRKWFQVCGNSVPLEGTKFGFIRSISYKDAESQEVSLQDRDSYAPTFYSSKNVSYSDRDSEYLELAKNPEANKDKLQAMVVEAAKRAGYDSPLLYHGTASFGFTHLSTSYSDDKISFFVTESEDTAKTYSFDAETRSVKPINTDELLMKADEAEKKFCDKIYSMLDYLNRLAGVYNFVDYIEQTDKVEDLLESHRTHDGFTDILTDYTMDLFYDAAERSGMSEEETDSGMDDFFDKYVYPIVNAGDAKRIAFDAWNKGTSGTGNYAFYGKLGNILEVEGYGRNWSNIPLGKIIQDFNDWWVAKGHEPALNGLYPTANTRSISEFAYEKGYDGVVFKDIVDDGGKSSKRATATNVYSLFKPSEQLKSANPVTYDDNGNVIPLSQRFNPQNEDIRYQDRSTQYDYNTLISKPDMKVTAIDDSKIHQANSETRKSIINQAVNNAKTIGISKNGNAVIHVDDIDADVILGSNGLRHSIDRRLQVNAPIIVKAGEILKNAVRLNELSPKTDNISNTYVLVGVAKNSKNEPYIVTFVVNRYTNEVSDIQVVYSVNAKTKVATKKESVGSLSPGITAVADYLTDSKISISELLKYVNRYFPDVLPESVLRKFGYDSRPEGKLGESALYQDRDPNALDNRTLLSKAMESAAQNEIEKKYIKDYQAKIDSINQEEMHLTELRAKIKELSFAKGRRDADQIRSLQDEATKTANRINTFDKQLLRLEASKPLKEVLNRERTAARKAAEKRANESLNAYKERATERQRELLTRYQDARKRGIDSRNRTALRAKIKNVVGELNAYLLKGTKNKHILIGMQKAVAEALDAVNMDTIDADARVAKYDALIAKATDPDVIESLTKTRDNIAGQGDKMSDKLNKLKASYSDIINSDDPLIAESIDDVVTSKTKAVVSLVRDTPLRNMTVEQLEAVYDLYTMVLTRIRGANKAFKAAKNEEISTISSRIMEELDALVKRSKFTTKSKDSIGKFGWNNLKPIYAFKAIGSKTLAKVFDSVRAGEDVWARDIAEAKAFYREITSRYDVKSWDMKKTYEFESTSGKTFSLNLQQIMSLYAFSKREQARDHIRGGGIVIDERMEMKKGLKTFVATDATAYNISDATLLDIIGKLSKEQAAYVDEMQDYLSTVMGAKGNEVSLEMYGVKLFNEKYYFPLKLATQYMAKAKEQQQGEVKIKNAGFSKETVQDANNPIVLSEFLDVWGSHVDEMSRYHAFVLPMEDFYRVFNYKTPTSENMATESIEMYIENTAGKGATQYIEQLLRDLNGGTRIDVTAAGINKGLSIFKKGAVMGSASVVIQQPSAIARVLPYIDLKYFIGQKVTKDKAWEEVKKYAPVAIIKEMGGYDTHTGKSTVDYITGQKGNLLDKFDDLLGKAPELADQVTWCAIWQAAKRKAKAETNLTGEALLRKAGDIFTEAIINTQVYDSVLSRSAMMRSKDGLVKMATAFMAEPTTSINMISDAQLDWKNGNKKAAVAKVSSVVTSVILNAALVAIVYSARDDDDDKTYWEKYISSVLSKVMEGVNPLTYIPIVKDIYSEVQGYTAKRTDLSVFSDLIKAIKNFDNAISNGEDIFNKSLDLANQCLMLFGIPSKNITRDVRALVNTYGMVVNGERGTKTGTKLALREGFTEGSVIAKRIMGENPGNAEQLYNALAEGDKAHAQRVRGRYDSEDKADTAYNKFVVEMYQKGKISKSKAVSYLVTNGGMEREAAEKKMNAVEFKQKYGFAWDDRAEAYKSGEVTRNQLINALVESGKTQEEAELQVEIYDWQNDGYDIDDSSVSVIKDYQDYCEPADIDKRTYYNAYLYYKDSGEEGVAYSKTKECMPYINNLPLTSYQKTQLALCWWGESTVKKYKLW